MRLDRKAWRLGVWLVLLGWAVPGVSATGGVTPSPKALAKLATWEAAEDEEDDLAGSLSLTFDAQGGGELAVWTAKEAPSNVRQRLQRALPCELAPPQSGEEDYIAGRCRGLLHKEGGVWRGRFDPAVVARALADDGSGVETYIALPRTAFSRCDGWRRVPFGGATVSCSPLPRPDGRAPAAVEIAYGYRPVDVAWRLAVLGLLAALPVLRILRRRRRVLAAVGEEERRAAWFAYWRAFRGVHQRGWMLWFAAFFALRLDDWIAFELPGTAARLAAQAALLAGPPALVFLISHTLSRPVLAHVRELALSRREAVEEALGYLLVGLVPLALMILGWTAISSGIGAWSACFGGAVAAGILGRRLLVRSTGQLPHALTVGELRDRIFALAGKVRVKLQGVYILSASRRRLANAFATSGNTVILTDYLLANLSKREAEAVVAHELAHLRYRHPLLLGLAVMAVIYTGMFAGTLFAPLAAWPLYVAGVIGASGATGKALEILQSISFLPLFLLACLLPVRWLSRRAERSADAYAGMLTGDPEAMISALGKLSRLSLMPLRWGRLEEAVSTHPAMERRGEALALRFGIPFDRMLQLLRGETGGAPETAAPAREESWDLPPSVLDPGRVFTTRFKTRVLATILWTTLFLTVALCLGAAVWVRSGGFSTPWVRFALALAGIAIARLAIGAAIAPLGYSTLRKKLAARLAAEGLGEAAAGTFGGFAPDSVPRSYEGHTVWDVGFLIFGAGALVFVGDQARFRLDRERITAVRLGRGYPGWLEVPNLYVDWRHEDETAHTFALRAIGGTLFGTRRRMRRLARKAEAWRLHGEGAVPLPPTAAELPPPPTAPVTGHAPREALRLRGTFVLLWLHALLISMAGLLLDEPGAILPALVLAVAVHVVLILPIIFYREPKGASTALQTSSTTPAILS
jgi:Zn-dependent protease with chaperone function